MPYLKIYQSFRWRLAFLVLFFAIAFFAVIGRVFSLAIVNYRIYTTAAEKQHSFSEILPPERGKIFFQDTEGNLYPLAINKNFTTLTASPRDIEDPQKTAEVLAGRLKLDRAELEAKLTKKNDTYENIAKNISDEDADFIKELSIDGLDLNRDSRRTYPNDSLGAGIIGFVSFDGQKENGEYGIERNFNGVLSGETGFFEGDRSAGTEGYLVALGKRILNPPVNGSNVVLTVDRNIQFKMEEVLVGLFKKWNPESAAGVVLDPVTGKILALSSLPSFNPNEYSKEKDYSVFRMPIIDSQFELGSVFKPITMAAGVNEGVVKPDTTYLDSGMVKFGSYTIKNFDEKGHGVQTMTQVLEKSLNTGAVYVEKLLGQERFAEYVKRFGFGEKSGIDFPNEVAGNIANLKSGRDIEFATASFGQGIAVTPIQMASAIGAIANGGVMMKPYIVDKIIDDAGNETVFAPEKKGEAINKETAETITRMLVSTVRIGYENRAGVKGYFVAGKTGTAQVPLKDKRGYSTDVVHTFVGYAPAFHPRFLVLLQLTRPTGNRFAANTMTSPFHDLAEFILNYYKVPPDEK
ncbi:MAG: penicillin-binding protein 2 [bacterium]|nr:penicillin-binding protein 2 [bacterium]